MGRYQRLTDEQRTAAADLAKNGAVNAEIAAAVGANRATVAKVAPRVRRTGDLQAPKSDGRPPLLDLRGRRRLVRMVLANDNLELCHLVAMFNDGMTVKILKRTAHRVIRDAGLQAARRRIKPYLSNKNRVKRLSWARKHRRGRRSGGKFLLQTKAASR
ncbi:hypothetical protein I4F81_003128 [Pyropia yezoensis]|uniref:Uncharacterized protein n=1 Tax=Pyropia yezoensis TaxID=2788 RepID=A0ACC3BS07_PYRYE|nr:hypothetical protein I4F81_003128 [Neopyropia yezoensis]